MELLEADTPEHLAIARELFREYRHTPGVDVCVQSFTDEIAGLPGEYGPPWGTLVVALIDDHPAGCVALRPLGSDICEMKRLYVRPSARRSGVGRALVRALIERARQIGYGRMRLDTLHSMQEAIALYESFGFRRIAPSGQDPLRHDIHMELELK